MTFDRWRENIRNGLGVLVLCAIGCSGSSEVAQTNTRLTALPLPETGLWYGALGGDLLPPKTVALTYDDGPDLHTLELAQYLHSEGIAATFFVVGRHFCASYDASGSCLGGRPTKPCDDGVEVAGGDVPPLFPETLLDQLTALGHRVANHTEDHCQLPDQGAADFDFELTTDQELLDRHITDGVTLFRPPYGDWAPQNFTDAHQDPRLDPLIGPILWDIDGADWSCWQTGQTVEQCGAGYLALLYARPQTNGVILMHDRPGYNVGSPLPLQFTQWLVPQLRSAGIGFASFDTILGRLSPHPFAESGLVSTGADFSDSEGYAAADSYYGSIGWGDVDGDGYADVCARDADGVKCALNAHDGTFGPASRWLATDLLDATGWLPDAYGSTMRLRDIDGDGRADVCARGIAGLRCASSTGNGFSSFDLRTSNGELGDADGFAAGPTYFATVALADVDGDGFADACARSPEGISCARNDGTGAFAARTLWLGSDFSDATGWGPAAYGSTIRFGDINGDGMADVCGRGIYGVRCALSTGTSFADSSYWSSGADFSDADGWLATTQYPTVQLADIDGDHRADLCGRGPAGIMCALSSGAGFAPSLLVVADDFSDRAQWDSSAYAGAIRFNDIDGDGHADVCGRGVAGIRCARAPSTY